MEEAPVSNKSDNIRDGKYLFLIKKLLLDELQEGPTFVAELEVVQAESKGDLNPTTKQPVTPNGVGTTVGYVQKLNKFLSAGGNTKKFLLAMMGMTEQEGKENDPEASKTAGEPVSKLRGLMDDLFSANGEKVQKARGVYIACSTYQQATKSGANAGQVNTYCNFEHVKQSAAEIAARRAKLDATEPRE